MSGATQFDAEYVLARRVLLDALEGLGPHRKAVVLIGAQAVYLHVGEGDLAVSPYTTDGDLALDPHELDDEPSLPATLAAAGFELSSDPGTWTRTDVQVDLLVPASIAGGGRRGARLGVHGNRVARKASGLEAALVDRSRQPVAALDPLDRRRFDVSVAGPAALLVAKLHKIYERKNDARRRQDKDALDVLRLLRFVDIEELGTTLVNLTSHSLAGETTRSARGYLEELFSTRAASGSAMAARACIGLEDEDVIRVSCEVLTRRLLDAWS